MIDNSIYREDTKYVASLDLPWEKLSNKSILITGASGLIGSFLIDVLMETSLDKGTQRKTTENELPSLTQCTA